MAAPRAGRPMLYGERLVKNNYHLTREMLEYLNARARERHTSASAILRELIAADMAARSAKRRRRAA